MKNLFRSLWLLSLVLFGMAGNALAVWAPVDTAAALTAFEGAVDIAGVATFAVLVITAFIGLALISLNGGTVINLIKSRGKRT